MTFSSNAASARGGVLWGRFKFAQSQLFREANGRFALFLDRAEAANVELAAKLAEDIADALRNSLKRPRVSTGMLERAILAPENRVAEPYGFGVGVPSYLDESAAKYWQQIEEGFGGHVGQQLRGLWGDAITYMGADYIKGDFTSQRDITGQLYPFGAPSGQGFRPFARADAQRALRDAGYDRRSASRTKGVIRTAIEPHEYFQKGWDAFGGVRTVEAAYDKAFAAIGTKVRWQNGRLAPIPRRAIAGR